MGDTGFEPVSRNCKPIVNKELTTNQNSVLSTGLDKILQKYPDLAQLVETWLNLPEHTKQAIMALVRGG
jgi:hypothetical protein